MREFLVNQHKLRLGHADCRRQHGWHGNHGLPETATDLMQEEMLGDLKCGDLS